MKRKEIYLYHYFYCDSNTNRNSNKIHIPHKQMLTQLKILDLLNSKKGKKRTGKKNSVFALIQIIKCQEVHR